jgi:DNA-binding PadR family transcriptional regulator
MQWVRSIHASLVRLQQRGWIAARWGTSDNNRKAKFYSITKSGRKQLAQDVAHWQRLTEVMGGFSPCRRKAVNNETFPPGSPQPDSFILP